MWSAQPASLSPSSPSLAANGGQTLTAANQYGHRPRAHGVPVELVLSLYLDQETIDLLQDPLTLECSCIYYFFSRIFLIQFYLKRQYHIERHECDVFIYIMFL